MNPSPKRPRWAKRLGVAAILVMVLAWPAWLLLSYWVGESEFTVFSGLIKRRAGLEQTPVQDLPEGAPDTGRWVAPDKNIVPFRQIGERLGARATGNNLINFRGVTIFDANGDGKLDLFFPHSGRPVTMVTGPDKVIQFETVEAKACTLFLNQGNDENGDPIFAAVQELAAANGTFVAEELLLENKYRPRTRLEDDEGRPGRVAMGAVAADFNGDGRQDLYILNNHHGLSFQTHEYGVRVYPTKDAIGRDARGDPVVIRVPSFLRGERTDGLNEMVTFGKKPEAEGRNVLLLNTGDRDNDGIPEWRDATDSAGAGGKWASTSAAVADVDRDGDLDMYVTNFLDPDFWGFGADHFAGNRNQLYINQLNETGELTFKESAVAWGVAGLHIDENLPTGSADLDGNVPEVAEPSEGEAADHSWAALLRDVDEDGYPDLVVANDISNRLRVYRSAGGTSFERVKMFDAPRWNGCWMGITAADLDGDGDEELFASNCGGQVMSVRNTALLLENYEEANTMARAVLGYPRGNSTMHNAVLELAGEGAFRDVAPLMKIDHSPVIPPDLSRPENFSRKYRDFYERGNFATSLTAYEFAWAAASVDVDHDGDLDLYWAGALARGNDGFIGDWTGGPGRLLVNESKPGAYAFRDETLAYRLLDISDVDYDADVPLRRAPGTGWHKRDTIYVTDADGYAGSGEAASRSTTRDIYRMHEFGNAVVSADLNGDGWEDIVVTHGGGYDSNLPSAGNMKVDMAGQKVAVPAPNPVMHPPTNFEEGPTFVFIHGGPRKDTQTHWVAIRLLDPESHNVFALGARIVANGKLRGMNVGGVAFSGTHAPTVVGLGNEPLTSLEVYWPSGDMAAETVALDTPVADRLICVAKGKGVVACEEAKRRILAGR